MTLKLNKVKGQYMMSMEKTRCKDQACNFMTWYHILLQLIWDGGSNMNFLEMYIFMQAQRLEGIEGN